jgi:hypothetical protein
VSPEDFADFVAAHANRVAAACHTLTGNDRLAEALQRDLFASVALRWWWLRRRPARSRAGTAAAYLDRLVRREAGNWRSENGARKGRLGLLPTDPEQHAERDTVEGLAQVAWRRATRIRNRRRVFAAVAVVAIGGFVVAAPRRSPLVTDQFERPAPLPTAVPAGVRVVPPFASLGTLPSRPTALPKAIDVTPGAATSLQQDPVAKAVAIAQQDLGPLIIVAADGSTRRVNDTALLGARMLTTSLSPDGARAALTTGDGLLVIDLTTGVLSRVGAGAQTQPAQTQPAQTQPAQPSLVWSSARTVLVPTHAGAQEVNVDSGSARTLAGLNGLDVVTTQGRSAGGHLVEMVPGSPSGLPARLRLWNPSAYARPGVLSHPTPTAASPSPTASPVSSVSPASPMPAAPGSPATDVEERLVSGPPWIGRWGGPGWSTLDLFVRACDPSSLLLPQTVGVARDALGAIAANGAALSTLAIVDGTTLSALGFVDRDIMLVSTGSPQAGTRVLAWNVRSGDLQSVASLSGYARISLPDLLSNP